MCVKNQFINGPCVATPDFSAIEIYATSGQRIYRRVINGSNTGSWAVVSSLDAGKLDTRADLDCSASGSTVHIAATGNNPVGAPMHAFGTNGTYNQFVREASSQVPSTFNIPGASVGAWQGSTTDSRFQIAGAGGNPAWYFIQDATNTTSLTPSALFPMTSNPDIAIGNGSDAAHFMLVAFMNGQMVYHDYYFGRGTNWMPSTMVDPPSGTSYSYAPTLCQVPPNTGGDYTRHLGAIAGNKLYVARTDADWTSNTGAIGITAWATAGSLTPASSPDCVVTSDGTVHIVVLTSNGTIARVSRKGTTGSWTTQDLGAF
jgi:hypothetical protein